MLESLATGVQNNNLRAYTSCVNGEEKAFARLQAFPNLFAKFEEIGPRPASQKAHEKTPIPTTARAGLEAFSHQGVACCPTTVFTPTFAGLSKKELIPLFRVGQNVLNSALV